MSENNAYKPLLNSKYTVPVNIYEGNLAIDFTNIAKWLKDGME